MVELSQPRIGDGALFEIEIAAQLLREEHWLLLSSVWSGVRGSGCGPVCVGAFETIASVDPFVAPVYPIAPADPV